MMTNARQAAEAVHHHLSALEESLRDDRPLPRSCATFCADGFERFAASKAWRGVFGEPDADQEFAALDRSQESDFDRMLGRGARLSERRLRKIGNGFCVAFGLSRHSKKPAAGHAPMTEAFTTTPEHLVQIRRPIGFSLRAEKVVVAAEGGDPGKLRQILAALAEAMQRMLATGAAVDAHRARAAGAPESPESPEPGWALPGRYVFFCADALRTLLDDSRAWAAVGRTDASPDDRRLFGRAVCRAFRLSRNQATLREGEYPKHVVAYPTPVFKFEELLHYGVSWREAFALVSEAFPYLSRRTLDEWLRFLAIQTPVAGTLGGGILIEHRRSLAAEVRRAVSSNPSLEDAYRVVARHLATRLFPGLRSQMTSWAARVLRESERHSSEQVELAREISVAAEKGQRLPPVPRPLAEAIQPAVQAERAETRLSDRAVEQLIPAVEKAHALRWSLAVQ